MKLAALLLIVAFHVSARGVSQITLSENNVSLEKVFNAIEKQSGYVFFYDYAWLGTAKTISITVRNASLVEVLNECFKGQPLTYTIIGKTIVVKQKEMVKQRGAEALVPALPPPPRVITGTISDEKGTPLAGVSISVKGSSAGTTTDEKGFFRLEIPEDGAVLSISYVGYAAKEIVVGNRTSINISLQPISKMNDEVVVVGYGTQKDRNITGSVGSVSMKNVQNQIVSGPDQLLTGQISGVTVTQPAGIPGGGPQIQVRGVGAIGAGYQPLYVIDGYPIPQSNSVVSNPLNNISPDDIASISVLKDASATSIYGSRGANGVILIETKKGISGKLQVELSEYAGIQSVPRKGQPDLMNASEFAQWRKDAISDVIRYEQGREPTLDDIPEAYRNPDQYGKGTDWVDAVERVAPIQQIGVNIRGGNDVIRSFFSAGYLNQKGVVIGTDYTKYSLRTNVDATIHNKIKIGLSLAPTFSTQNLSSIGGAGRGEPGFGYALSASPISPIYNADGTFVPMINSPGTFSFANPLLGVKNVKNKSQNFEGTMNGFIELKVLKVLTLRSAVNLAYSSTRHEEFHPSYIGGTNLNPPVIPNSIYGSPSFLNYDFENTIAYQRELNGGHSINAIGGYTFQRNNSLSASFKGNNYPSDEVETLNAASLITGATTEEDWTLISYFARTNYSYLDKYLLTATFRRDGSSRFGRNSQWGNFPSASLGWRISKEPFMNSVKWINDMKLRISYGVNGNFNIGNYSYVSHVQTSDYILGGGRAPGQILSSLGNPDLKWERSREINVGLDAGFWNRRLSIAIDLYKRNTVDMLLDDEVPASSGFSSVTVNRGNVENTGLELGINSINLSNRSKIQWTSNLTFAANRNKVLSLGQSGAPIYAGSGGGGVNSNVTAIGQPIGLFFGWDILGLYQNEDDVKNSPSYPTAVPGDLKFKDVNGDGKLTAFDDFTIIGNPYPDFTWGFTNMLSYKGFNLRILITGSYGGQMYRQDHHYYHNTDGVFNVSRDILNSWRSPEDPGNGIVPNNAGSESRRFYRMINSGAIESNSYAMVKNITLGYDIPKFSEYINNFHVYVSAQNVFLFTKYGGSNPEGTNYNAGSGDGVLAPGSDYVSYPVPRIIAFGLKLGL